MRRVSLAILSSLCACSCPGGDICTSTGQTAETSSFSIAGEAVTIPMFLPVNCGARVPDSVTVSILGPDDKNVPFQDGGTATVDMTGFTAPVTFVPPTPGAYHLAARFEPNLGLAQYDLLAAADHRADVPAFTISASSINACDRVEVTPSGALVCLGSTGATIFRGGSMTPMTGKTDYSAGALWLVDDKNTLTRYLDSDAGFVMAESTSLPVVSGNLKLLAAPDNVVLWQGLTPQLFTPADGGLSSVTLQPVAGTPDWRNDDVYGELSFTSLCIEPLDGGSFAKTCPPLSGFSTGLTEMGTDTTGIWGTEMVATGTFVYHIDPDSSLSLKMPSGWTPATTTGGWEHAAILNGSAADGPRVLNGGIGIEVFTKAGESLGPVCTHFAVVNDGPNARVIARQSP